MNLITVFTPTYNRVKTLKRVYESLLNQTCKDFEWLIIDDGSTDNTEKIVKAWKNDNYISITYIKQKNNGKAKSINKSLELTNTALWICLDSDDFFIPRAIEIIKQKYKIIESKEDVCGMISLRIFENGEPMQKTKIPDTLMFSTQGNLRYNLNIEPEYAQVYKTSVAKEYLYPEIEGENYFPLSYVADQMDLDYELLVLHESFMVIEYQEDGITNNNKKHVINNPIGQTLFRHQQVEIGVNWKVKIKSSIIYNSASLLSKKRYDFIKITDRILVMVTYPLGILDYIFRLNKN